MPPWAWIWLACFPLLRWQHDVSQVVVGNAEGMTKRGPLKTRFGREDWKIGDIWAWSSASLQYKSASLSPSFRCPPLPDLWGPRAQHPTCSFFHLPFFCREENSGPHWNSPLYLISFYILLTFFYAWGYEGTVSPPGIIWPCQGPRIARCKEGNISAWGPLDWSWLGFWPM